MSDMLPRPEPRDAFKRALRSQLMAQAATTLARRETSWSRFQRALTRPAVRPALALAAVVLVLIGGAGKAAADSLPGDVAFGLKAAAEELQLAFAFDDTSRLQLLSDDADHRLAELARALTARPESAPVATEQYAAAVARFTAAVDALRGRPDSSADKRSLARDVVDAAHLKHQAVLDALERTAPESAHDGLDRARHEADKLHASGSPARTAEPSDDPEQTRTPQPTKTTNPGRTPEPARTGRPTETPDRTRTAPAATPSVRR